MAMNKVEIILKNEKIKEEIKKWKDNMTIVKKNKERIKEKLYLAYFHATFLN